MCSFIFVRCNSNRLVVYKYLVVLPESRLGSNRIAILNVMPFDTGRMRAGGGDGVLCHLVLEKVLSYV